MAPDLLIGPGLVCYTIIVVVVFIEHHFCKHWPEILRRGLGTVTVCIATLIPALMGIIDIWTWIFIALAFIMAGAMLAFLIVKDMSEKHETTIDKLVSTLTGDENA